MTGAPRPRPEPRGARLAIAPSAAAPVLLGALYVGAVLLPFRGFLAQFATHLIGDHPDALLQHLHCAWQWQALAEGRLGDLLRLPTMYPYRSGLAFGEPLVGVTLPFAAVYTATGSTAAAYNAAVVASFPLLGLAVFLWVRDLYDSAAAGLLAAVLVVFVPWRVHFLTALNLLMVHYAVFGLWLLGRWLRRPRLATLVGAALCFHVQLVTAAQGGIVALFLAAGWVAAVWLRSGLRCTALRARHGALALALFAALSAPWLAFFDEAFAAARGLPRTDQMHRFSLPVVEMARFFGAVGPLGALALVGAPWLAVAIRRGRLRDGLGAELLGLSLAAAALFVVGRGPYLGPPTDPTPLPGELAARALPWLDLFRAPIRLAALTPLLLAVVAGGTMALFERFARERLPRRGAALCLLLPIGLATLWPPLGAAMRAPIAQRTADRELATALSELSADAVILPLPLDLEPSGAAVDEWVLIHRRAQVGGFASIMPPLFPQLANLLGQWPFDGAQTPAQVGATHLVVPDAWLRRGEGEAARAGYRTLASVSGHSIVAVPPRPVDRPSLRARAPATAAADRWLALSVVASGPELFLRGHEPLAARWRSGARTLRMDALALYPGIASPELPILIHVPTPDSPGHWELSVDFPPLAIDAEIDVRDAPTTADAPIRSARVELAQGYAPPDAVRAGGSYRVAARLEAGPGPILLATSLRRLPDRRGETLVVYRYRARSGAPATGAIAQTGLSADLLPGERLDQTWYLSAPPRPGRYDLLVRLAARGHASMPMPWVPLIRDLRVVAD